MKRSDIHVGDELFYARSNAWQKYGDGCKAVVVDTQPYSITRVTYGSDYYRPDANGKAVLVDLYDSHVSDKPRRTAVPTAHLRGPYEATKAEADRLASADREQSRAESQRAQEAWTEAKTIEESAQAAGIDARAHHLPSYDGPQFVLTPADMAKLLDAYTR